MIDRYSRPEMAELWSQQSKFQAWLEVEIAVCEAWSRLGAVPPDALADIKARAGFDLDRILEIEKTTRHDVIAFLTAVEEQVGENARFIHMGCTSSDIVDTANGLLLGRAGDLILEALDRLLSVLAGMARKHKGQLIMGRTHGVHAEPTSFGLKMAGFHAEFARHRRRLATAVENVRIGKISGAVGGYAFLSPELERHACEILGLTPDPISTQIVQRDRHAELFSALGLLGGGIERLGVELRHLQRTEVLEAEEGFAAGQKGSSAMPHKKNPISAENLCGLARLLRTNALAAMENMALWHERDISHSSVERVIMPDSTTLAHYMLHRMSGVLEKLRIDPENMVRNLMGSYGLFFSQRVLQALLEAGLPRQQAYEMVQKTAMRCWNDQTPFPEAVRDDADIAARLTPEQLETIFDLESYLDHEGEILDRVLPPEGDHA
jgi:adenylosuccinate lyase